MINAITERLHFHTGKRRSTVLVHVSKDLWWGCSLVVGDQAHAQSLVKRSLPRLFGLLQGDFCLYLHLHLGLVENHKGAGVTRALRGGVTQGWPGGRHAQPGNSGFLMTEESGGAGSEASSSGLKISSSTLVKSFLRGFRDSAFSLIVEKEAQAASEGPDFRCGDKWENVTSHVALRWENSSCRCSIDTSHDHLWQGCGWHQQTVSGDRWTPGDTHFSPQQKVWSQAHQSGKKICYDPFKNMLPTAHKTITSGRKVYKRHLPGWEYDRTPVDGERGSFQATEVMVFDRRRWFDRCRHGHLALTGSHDAYRRLTGSLGKQKRIFTPLKPSQQYHIRFNTHSKGWVTSPKIIQKINIFIISQYWKWSK